MSAIDTIKSRLKFYPGFPKEGIVFIDVLPLLADAGTLELLTGELVKLITTPNIAAPEARGFLFASPLLMAAGGPECLMVFRKSGKLPAGEGDLVKIPVVKEYGDDSIHFRISDFANAKPTPDGEQVAIEITIFDDILATGGTAEGMARHLNDVVVDTPWGKLPVRVREFVFLGEIAGLGGAERLSKIAPVKSLLKL